MAGNNARQSSAMEVAVHRCVCHHSHASVSVTVLLPPAGSSHQANQAQSARGLLELLAALLGRAVSAVLSSQLCCYICIPGRSFCQCRAVVFPHLQNTLMQTPCDSAPRGQL